MPSPNLFAVASQIDPQKTVLLLGAGASRSSGAPLAIDLCRQLERKLASGEKISDDLSELAGILEHRCGRRPLVDAVVSALSGLHPDGGLLALAEYRWKAIYTTNFDRLVEDAFSKKQRKIGVVRSNFDWEETHDPSKVPLFKIHGCVSQDRAYGHRASMVLTENDYTDYEEYRKLLFGRLALDMAGSTTWIIGYSMRDAHVRSLADEALRQQRKSGAPGQIYLLVYEYDDERAALWRQRGIRDVAQGDLNSFAHALTLAHVTRPTPSGSSTAYMLPLELEACTIQVNTDTSASNARRMFFGGTATYGDIRAGLTFERDREFELRKVDRLVTLITGVSGVGKSTLARRILHSLSGDGWLCYEHRHEFPLSPDAWVEHERSLSSVDKKAILLIDNCPTFQRQVNSLVRRLPLDGALRVLLTAETSAWKPRQKDPRLFTAARTEILSTLSASEVSLLRDLLVNTPNLKQLVAAPFASRSRMGQIDHLRRRCSADMFVCLKALTESDSLDDIILREFAAIEASQQDVYRLTAALEAAGALPHRQMVLRLSGISASQISSMLDVLEGVIEETEERSNDGSDQGIYLWRTRHEVIAQIVAKYKYSDPAERGQLFENVIETANPTYYVELRSLRELCNGDWGIRSIPDAGHRQALYRKIAAVVPNDRVSRHRLVKELLDADLLGDAEAELRSAADDLGLDPPFQRYKVLLSIQRSRSADLPLDDRKAMLRQAVNEAEMGLSRFRESKYMYLVLADVAEEWHSLTGETGLVEWAVLHIRKGYDLLQDPDLLERIDRLRRIR
jgi:hypothetical protein